MATLITLEQIKLLLGVSDTTYDPQIQFSLDLASKLIQDYTGRELVYAQYTEKFFRPRFVLDLGEFPAYTVESSTPELPAEYEFHRSTGLIRTKMSMEAMSDITIVYTAGYSDMPADLVGVVLELVRRQLAAMNVDIPALASLSPQTKGVTVGTLKVDYAVSAMTSQQNTGTVVLSQIIRQFGDVLNLYVHPRRLAAVG